MQLGFYRGHPHELAPAMLAHRVLRGMHGSSLISLGQAPSTPPPSTFGTIASFAASGASVTAGILGSMAAFTATGVALGPLTLGISAAVTGLITIGTLIAKQFAGCGQTCIEASNYANQVEQYLKQNLQTYLAAPVHYASLQAAAENNFNTAWQALNQACGTGALANTTAGTNCIGDRTQGACHYHTSPGGWSNGVYTYPGANGSGSTCWNWFVGYYDPIAQDPTVVPDPSTGSTSSTSPSQGAGTSTGSVGTTDAGAFPLMPILLGAGLLLLLVEES